MTPIEKAKDDINQVVNAPDDFLFTAKFLRNNLQTILVALEAEEPADDYDISECTSDIQSVIHDELVAYDEVKRLVKIYAESYHAKKCAECIK